MRLTKKRKAYVAVFGLGLVALVADRMFFAPAGASGAPPEIDPGALRPAPSRPAAEHIPEADPAPSFAHRLGEQVKWQEGPARDAFLASESWVGPRTTQGVPAEAVSAAAFAEKHVVTAAAKGVRGGFALVDGKTFRIGDTLDGYKFVDIGDSKDKGSAIFERDGVRVELVVADKLGVRRPDKGAQ